MEGVLVTGLIVHNRLPIPVAIIVVIGVGALIGLVNGLIVTKARVNSVIATLGMGTIIVGLNFAYSSGVPIVAGVDSPLVPYGAALHTEIAGYVEAGFTPFQALQTATINTATLLNAQNDLGTLEVGKLADMAIVEGNPLVNIRDTMRVRKVIKNGAVFTIDELLNVPRGQTTAGPGGSHR